MSAPQEKPSLVVIGNGMAGMRTVEELLAIAPDHYQITVFGEEPHGNYNRIMLSPVLAGEKNLDEIFLNPLQWYEENNITLHAGDQVLNIDRAKRIVRSESGREVHYDRLLIATGSLPFILPVPGKDLPGVCSFRDIADVDYMLEAANHYRNAVVIGGGLLGLEAANGLLARGMKVTVVHLADSLMERQLDTTAGWLLRSALETRGVDFLMEAQTCELFGDHRVRGLRFTHGQEIVADLVVMAAGIKPNINLAQAVGLHCERGIVVDDTMQTYDPRIYAVGECAQHRGICYGLVAPLWDQARTCASHLATQGAGRYEGSSTATSLKVSGVNLYSAGDFAESEDSSIAEYRDQSANVYKRLIFRQSRLAGVVMYGDTSDGPWFHELIKEQTDISNIRDCMMFGKAACGDLLAELPKAA